MLYRCEIGLYHIYCTSD